ncbi:HalOD1 output domain-containing protein [Salinigranum sp. GCM10025319]|uniref:HalOD1 output domain-containing protein n=1 Tax=Salinigranum sp. GCM10025319 TaxID=3252687 RepID=UPI003615E032
MTPHDHGDRIPGDEAGADAVHTIRLAADEPTALAIVHAVSTALKRPPLELEPLSAQLDPEALDNLLSGPIGRREDLSVSFAFEGCTVVVTPTSISIHRDRSADG